MSIEYIGLIISASLLLLYHVYLYIRTRRNPSKVIQHVNREARAAWIKYIMQEESRMILGIQTLRNSTMVTTFMASTAVLLMMATLNLIGRSETVSDVWHSLNLAGPGSPELWMIKVLALVTDFFVAFFCFAMAVRIYNHLGFQMNLPLKEQPQPRPVEFAVASMNRAGSYYTIGMRAYYFSVPLVFWLFSPLLMVASTLVLLAVLFINDRAPVH